MFEKGQLNTVRNSMPGDTWRMRCRRLLLCLGLAVAGMAPGGQAVAADSASESKLSLIEVAPALYKTAKRYPSFYGDAATTQGGFSERSRLLGNLNGDRDRLVDRGIYVDLGVTQFMQGNLSDGNRQSPDPRYNGSTDLYFWLDTGKLDWWAGGAFFGHFEANWATSMNGDVGSILPANTDATMPAATNPPSSALSEFYFLQALPGHLVAAVGKQDMAAWADTNLFANNERNQFTYTGLVNNAIAGVFFPYTAIGAWLDWAPSKKHNLVGVWAESDSKAGQTGFDNVLNSDNSYALQYIYSTAIGDRPGNYLLAALYSTKDLDKFEIYRGRLLQGTTTDIVGPTGLVEESENYGVVGNFAQYLWVRDESAAAFHSRQHATKARHVGPPVGIGLFARAGWSPEDRNAIAQFYSLGIGGYGMIIPGRDADKWGLGWAGSRMSDDLRDLTGTPRSWEHAFEVFYNAALTPALHLSLNGQAIRSAVKGDDTAYTLGARLQMDF
jgi:carbohydrate-selective porin OprB